MAEVQKAWDNDARPPLIQLTPRDFMKGWEALERVGMMRSEWFVCVHVREGGFKGEPIYYAANARIESYLPAIRRITETGGWVVRMGDPSMTKLPRMDRVIDYANSDMRSPWMDVFLSAQCRFYLGTSSGLIHVPFAFHTPTLASNWTPISARPYSSRDLFILKLYRSAADGRILSFPEAFASRAQQCYNANVFAAHGIELIDNSEDDIADAVSEMMQRLAGRFIESEDDRDLRRRFDAIATRHASRRGSYGLNSRIGALFLRKHRALLD
jgi:putative glycosyltransferase (TIGR04372 family)